MPEYALRTIKDIFDKVPPDRVGDCMNELATLMTVLSNTVEMVRTVGKGIEDIDPEQKGFPYPFTFPDEIVWKDDGKRDLGASFQANGKPFMRLEIQKKK